MDNLIKALKCFTNNCPNITRCETCPYYQLDYDVNINLVDDAIAKITSLQASNRNWRRKAQRLREKIKELKEKENV